MTKFLGVRKGRVRESEREREREPEGGRDVAAAV